MTPAAFLDFAKTYFRISPTGRCWIRSRQRRAGRRPQGGRLPLLADKVSRKDMIHKLLVCDRAFRDHVPDNLLRRMGRQRRLVYERFIPFAFINRSETSLVNITPLGKGQLEPDNPCLGAI